MNTEQNRTEQKSEGDQNMCTITKQIKNECEPKPKNNTILKYISQCAAVRRRVCVCGFSIYFRPISRNEELRAL